MSDSSVLMNALMNRLYSALAEDQDGIAARADRERFITWCIPGIPLDAEELAFATRGLVGRGDTPEKKAEDTAMLLGRASRFARLMDFAPEPGGMLDEGKQDAVFNHEGPTLSRIYERVLKQSPVAASTLTDVEKARIERFRNLLYPEKDVENILTGEIAKRRVEGPVLQEYKRFQKRYEDELFAYNDARIRALAAPTSRTS